MWPFLLRTSIGFRRGVLLRQSQGLLLRADSFTASRPSGSRRLTTLVQQSRLEASNWSQTQSVLPPISSRRLGRCGGQRGGRPGEASQPRTAGGRDRGKRSSSTTSQWPSLGAGRGTMLWWLRRATANSLNGILSEQTDSDPSASWSFLPTATGRSNSSKGSLRLGDTSAAWEVAKRSRPPQRPQKFSGFEVGSQRLCANKSRQNLRRSRTSKRSQLHRAGSLVARQGWVPLHQQRRRARTSDVKAGTTQRRRQSSG